MSDREKTHSLDWFYQTYNDLVLQIKSSHDSVRKKQKDKQFYLCKAELNQFCSRIEKSIEWLDKKKRSIYDEKTNDEKKIHKMVTSIYRLKLICCNKLLDKFQQSKCKTHNFDMKSDCMDTVYNLLREKKCKLIRRDMQNDLTRQVAHKFFKHKRLSGEELRECFNYMKQTYKTLKNYDQNCAFWLLLQAGCKRDANGNILSKFELKEDNFNDENEAYEWLQKQVHCYVIKLAHSANITLIPAEWSISFYGDPDTKKELMQSIISELRKEENLDIWRGKFKCRLNQVKENLYGSTDINLMLKSGQDLIELIESRPTLLDQRSNGTLDLEKDCCGNDNLLWRHDPNDYHYQDRIVEYLEHFARTLTAFFKYLALCQSLIDQQLALQQLIHQQAQARSRFNLPNLHKRTSSSRKLETRDNFLGNQSTPSLQNRATNSRTNHAQLPSIGSNNQSPRGNLNWAIRSETPPQKRSPTPEVPFNINVNNCSLNSAAQDTKPTDGTNRKSHV